jgi:Ca2+-binding EF-hand superfamily protein
MKDYDKLRHGNITKDQFRLSLNMAKIPLSEAEFKLILQHFETENKQNYVDWKSFCDNLDEVFNLK